MRTFLLALLLAPLASVSAQFTEHIIDSTDLHLPRGICAGDLDGDGDNDVAVISRENLSDSKLVWYANDGTGQFGPQQPIDQRSTGEQVEADDLDGDGDLDLMATWSWGQRVRPYYNDGTGQFTVGPEVAFVGNLYSWSFLLSDVTGDGSPDAVISGDPNQLGLVANDGSGGFLPLQPITGGAHVAVSLRSFDADLDGLQDLLYAGTSLGDVVWQKGIGGGSFNNTTFIANTNNSSLNMVQTADLNGDGHPDILFKWFGPGYPTHSLVWAENDSGSFVNTNVITTAGQSIQKVICTDLNADGDIDVIASRMTDETIEWYANDGVGNFSPAQTITTTCDSVWWIATADMDGDGVEDIVASAMRGDAVSWYGNPGLSTSLPSSTAGASGLHAAPMPFGPSTVLTSDVLLTSEHRIRLIDAHGRTLRSWTGNGSRQVTIDRGELAVGVYVVRVDRNGALLGHVRLIAE